MELKEKRIIVTGGSRGIGYAIAEGMIKEGAKVLITGRNEESLQEAIGRLGDNARYLVWDAADIPEIPEKLEKALELLGGIDILVNNAGILTKQDCDGFFAITPKSWDATMDTNLKSVFFMCQAVSKYWVDNKLTGKIINICSNNAFLSRATAYATAKWGVRGLTQGLAKRLAPYNITVNAVAPGCTSTSMLGAEDGEIRKADYIPMGRYTLPSEIADMCLFLASDKSKGIVGHILVADGGEILS